MQVGNVPRRIVAEFVGTALLVAAVVGSGTMAQNLATDHVVALLANTIATAVTIARAFSDTFAGIRPNDVAGFIGAQAVGALVGGLLFSWLIPLTRPVEVHA